MILGSLRPAKLPSYTIESAKSRRLSAYSLRDVSFCTRKPGLVECHYPTTKRIPSTALRFPSEAMPVTQANGLSWGPIFSPVILT
jgi:hypothetical protein